MRLPELGWLLRKEFRELVSSRAFWLLLFAVDLLTAHAFLTAVTTYAEMSGTSGGPAALPAGLHPLDGIVVPTLGAISLAATLLLPFVAIRLVAHEKENGAWKILLQGPATVPTQLLAKLIAILTGWLLAWLPALLALLLWASYRNHLYAPETLAALLGHFLFGWVTIGVAFAAAALAESQATAATITLGFTIGTWALEFVGTIRGGLAERLASLTPSAALRPFERGLLRSDALVMMLLVGLLGLAVASIWLHSGRRLGARWLRTGAVVAVAGLLAFGAGQWRARWDLSEDQRNSFPHAVQTALRAIRLPLRVEAHLAPEDPRRADLESSLLDKLEPLFPRLDVVYQSRTVTGLFERSGEGYGEIWYQLGSKRVMTRSTTPDIVLPLLYDLGGVVPPAAVDAAARGYPMVRQPAGASVIFVGWPLLLLLGYGIRSLVRKNVTP